MALKSAEILHDYKQSLYNTEATSFLALLRDCARKKDLYQGSKVHDDIIKRGLLDTCLDDLVIMYAKCGALAKARELLGMHNSRNEFCWTALITGYAQQGNVHDALNCFEYMQHEGLSPNAVTCACMLKVCGSMKDAEKGAKLHDEILRIGLLESNPMLGTVLVDMYANCGLLAKSQQVLEELPVRNLVSWSALISRYAQEGLGEQALSCFERMQQEGFSPNAVTFACALKACGVIGAVDKGKEIHDEVARQGLLKDNIVLGTAVLDMYAKCGFLTKAKQVLGLLPVRNIISWSALIMGYAEQGQGEEAVNCFEQMQSEGLYPNTVTYACILKACGSVKAHEKGKRIHKEIAKQGFLGVSTLLETALIDMYAKCGALAKARQVLEELPHKDVVAWNAIITGYAEHGQGEPALNCYERMQREGLSPDEVTFGSVLKACGSIAATDKGEQIHDKIAKQGLLGKDVVLANALIDMYAKCGALSKAHQVLKDLHVRDLTSWNTLITGYAQQGQEEQAIESFEQLQQEGLHPNPVTYACMLKAYGSMGAADKGEEIHEEIARRGLVEGNTVLGTALVDMYSKCGALKKAHLVLEELASRDVSSWNALITGYVQQGQGEQALNCFQCMQSEGLSPGAITLSCMLDACTHVGLVDGGRMYFENMSSKYGIIPGIEHYIGMVDLFGRIGYLEKAVGLIQKTPFSLSSAMWSALLCACRKWGDVDVGRWAFEHAVQADKRNAGNYVIMADIYRAAGMHENAESIEAMRIENKAWNRAGVDLEECKGMHAGSRSLWPGFQVINIGDFPSYAKSPCFISKVIRPSHDNKGMSS